MTARARLVLATFLCLVPVTLMVPGLHELVGIRYSAGDREAHWFMSVNMLAGMLAVPLVLRAVKRSGGNAARWAAVALAVDALAFVGMAWAPSLAWLMTFRVLDGMAHLPAITLLMVSGSRLHGAARGGTMGSLASSIMVGVAVGSPLGGRLVGGGPAVVYLTGAALLVLGALVVGTVSVPAATHPARDRYRWRRTPETWIPLGYAFLDRFSVGVFVSTFTLYLTHVAGLAPAQRGALVALFMGPFALLCYPVGRLADTRGWFAPLVVGNVLFGITFATYGMVPVAWLPVVMVASGVFSALMFAPSLLLVAELSHRGAGDGLFGAFQMAGSLGFLLGPMAGGILVSATRNALGEPAYASIFAGVGALTLVMAVLTLRAFPARHRAVAPALPTSR